MNNSKLSILLGIIFILFFTSCKYEREENCHLDILHLNGDVVKVETIVQSSIPFTELVSQTYSPGSVISMTNSNSIINFDKKGNVKKYKVYGIDQKELFSEKYFNPILDCNTYTPVLIYTGATTIDEIIPIDNYDDDFLDIEYYSKKALIFTQKVHYDKNGNIDYIIKEYPKTYIQYNTFNIPDHEVDTTFYRYLKIDDKNNWTEMEVEFKGSLEKYRVNYKVKRQITYNDESTKEPLKLQYSKYNKDIKSNLSYDYKEVEIYNLGKINIPTFMVPEDKEVVEDIKNNNIEYGLLPINYLFSYKYYNKDAYVTYSLNISDSDISEINDYSTTALANNKEFDKQLMNAMEERLKLDNSTLLKWLPYEIVKINDNRAIKISYYRYGILSPIPVYVENYMIPYKKKMLTLTYSFQADRKNLLHDSFKESINSVKFNY